MKARHDLTLIYSIVIRILLEFSLSHWDRELSVPHAAAADIRRCGLPLEWSAHRIAATLGEGFCWRSIEQGFSGPFVELAGMELS